MPAPYGVQPNGFNCPALTDIQSDINASLVSTFGAQINTNAESYIGQLSGIFSNALLLVWQATQDTYMSLYPNGASGTALDNIGAISGIPRLQAQSSTVQNVNLFGTTGTVIPSSTQLAVSGSPSSIFGSTASVTLTEGANCVQTISFSAAPTVGTWQISLDGQQTTVLSYTATASQVQTAIESLLFYTSACTVTGNYSTGFVVTFNGAGTGGLQTQNTFQVVTNTLEASGSLVSITPTITTPGANQGQVNFTAITTGPIQANAGTLNLVVTPVNGLSAAINLTDAVLGRNVETDTAYRQRRAQSLQIAGAGTFEAIRSQLLNVSEVTAVIIFENDQNINDSSGRPPHSFEAVVQGGDPQAIANEIFLAKPAGILTFGTTSETVTDTQGQTHIINFSLPTVLNVYLIVQLSIDSTYPSNGDATVIQSIITYVNGLGIGTELIISPKLISTLASISGIQDVIILAGTSPNPTTSNNIYVSTAQILNVQSTNIQVTII